MVRGYASGRAMLGGPFERDAGINGCDGSRHGAHHAVVRGYGAGRAMLGGPWACGRAILGGPDTGNRAHPRIPAMREDAAANAASSSAGSAGAVGTASRRGIQLRQPA